MTQINMSIANIAQRAGYDLTGKSLEDLKKEYAHRSLKFPYFDQFDMMLGEALGMHRMNQSQLEAFVAN